MTMGAETMSVFTNSKSSTAARFPGDACTVLSEHDAVNEDRQYLFVQNELRSLLPLACLWNPYLDFQLFARQGISQEALRQTLAERDAGQPRTATEVLDHRVRTEHIRRDVLSVGPVHGVVFISVEEPHCSGFGGLGRESREEGAEAGVRRVVCTVPTRSARKPALATSRRTNLVLRVLLLSIHQRHGRRSESERGPETEHARLRRAWGHGGGSTRRTRRRVRAECRAFELRSAYKRDRTGASKFL